MMLGGIVIVLIVRLGTIGERFPIEGRAEGPSPSQHECGQFRARPSHGH